MSGHDPPAQMPGGSPNRPSSKIHLINKGLATPRPEVITIARPTSPTFRLYGRNAAITRRTVARSIGRRSSSTGGTRKKPCRPMKRAYGGRRATPAAPRHRASLLLGEAGTFDLGGEVGVAVIDEVVIGAR